MMRKLLLELATLERLETKLGSKVDSKLWFQIQNTKRALKRRVSELRKLGLEEL